MKKYYLIIFAIFSLIQGLIGQPDTLQLDKIDSLKINTLKNLPSFTKLVKVNNETGNRIVYLKNNDLKLITVYSKDNNIEKNVEWYFSDGELIYSEQKWIDLTTGKVINNEKIYVSNGHLIACEKTNGKFVDQDSDEFKDLDKRFAEYGEKLEKENN